MFHVLLPLVLHILTFVLFLRSTRAEVLVDFQVHQPLTLPKDVKQCTIPLFECDIFHSSRENPQILIYFAPATLLQSLKECTSLNQTNHHQ